MNFKRLTSLLLTLVMMVSLVPMAAFADETTPAEIQPCIEGCVAEFHAEGCEGTTCTEECVQASHAEGCPNAVVKPSTCVEGCSEETHVFGCDKYVAPTQPAEQPASETPTNEGVMLLNEVKSGPQLFMVLGEDVSGPYALPNDGVGYTMYTDETITVNFGELLEDGFTTPPKHIVNSWAGDKQITEINGDNNVLSISCEEDEYIYKVEPKAAGTSTVTFKQGETVIATVNFTVKSGCRAVSAVISGFDGSVAAYNDCGGSFTGVTNGYTTVAFKNNGEIIDATYITVESVKDGNNNVIENGVTAQLYEKDSKVLKLYPGSNLTSGKTYTVTFAVKQSASDESVENVSISYTYYALGVTYTLTEGETTSTPANCENTLWNAAAPLINLHYKKNTCLTINVSGGVIDEANQGDKMGKILDINGVSGEKGGSINWDAQFKIDDSTVKAFPGPRDGATSIDMEIKMPNGARVKYRVSLIVLGNREEVDFEDSWYKDAKIIVAADKSAPVEICDATASTALTDTERTNGFYISDGKVYFALEKTLYKTDSIYNVTVDGKNYAVIFTPDVAGTFSAEEERKVVISDHQLRSAEVNGELSAGYNFTSYNSIDKEWQADGGEKFGIETTDTGYLYHPFYIVKADENRNAVSIGDDAQIKYLNGNVNWIKVETVSIGTDADGNPINAFRVSIVPQDGKNYIVPSLYLQATIGLFTEDESPRELKLSSYSLDDIPFRNIKDIPFGISEPKDKGTMPQAWTSPKSLVEIKRTFDEINGTNPFANIIVTRGSGQPVFVEPALYDDIDYTTFKVTTAADSKLDIKYITKDIDGDNCIGVSVALKNGTYTTDIAEDIKIEFQRLGDETVYYLYGSVFIYEHADVEVEDTTVNNVDAFLEAYEQMASGTLTLEGGTYTFDRTFVHYRETVKIVGAAGAEVIFKRNEDSTGPVITVNGTASIENITVDGGKTINGNITPYRIGVYGSPSTFNDITLKNVTVKNCTIAVNNAANTGSAIIDGCVLENNNVAVEIPYVLHEITNTTFKNNGTAVTVGSGCWEIPVVKNCSFVDNTKDLVTANEYEVKLQQNYFGTTASGMKEKPVIEAVEKGRTDKVYYVPYYTTAARNILATTTEGAKVEEVSTFAARTTAKNLKYTLPVDLTINPASVMESGIFAEIVKTENYIDNVVVEIPVTSADGEVLWQFSNDALATEKDFNPTTDITNIAVGDNLTTSGETAVANNKGNATVYHELSFAHHGKLPGQARVTVDGEYKDINETLCLYHIVDGKLELVENGIVGIETVGEGENKKLNYTVSIDGCSEYIISTAIVVEEDTTGGSSSGSTSSATTATPVPTATPAPTKAPTTAAVTTPSANDFISAVEVEEKIKNAEEAEVVFDVSKKDIVSAKAFELIAAAEGKTLVFETDSFKWTFAAADITDAKAIDGTAFKPTISLESPNADEIKSVAGEVAESFKHIYFAHHGKLPGKAKVEVFVGNSEAGATKHVYHYIPAQKAFEFIDTITITAEGWAAFEIYHCSDYILSDVMLDTSLVIDAEAETPTQPEAPVVDNTVEEPAQQESGIGVLPIIIVVAVIALAVIIVLVKKNKVEE